MESITPPKYPSIHKLTDFWLFSYGEFQVLLKIAPMNKKLNDIKKRKNDSDLFLMIFSFETFINDKTLMKTYSI